MAPPAPLAPLASVSDRERASHTYGKAYPDLVRGLRGSFELAPDFVVYPQAEDDVARVLEHCERERLAAIPYGGGTSVVSGVEAAIGDGYRGAVSIDMSQMARVITAKSSSAHSSCASGSAACASNPAETITS